MPICKQCGKQFERRIMLDGKKIDLGSHRKRCLECFPFGLNNINNGKKCVVCGKILIGRQTKFCSSRCKSRDGYKKQYKPHPRVKKPPKTKEEKIIDRRKYRAKIYMERDRIFGKKCKICGYGKNLDLHRKSGEQHIATFEWIRTAIKNPSEWVRLCTKCHTGSHFCMDFFGWSWEDIEKHIINYK